MQDYKMLFQRSLQPLIGQKLVELFQAMPHHSSTDILKIDPGVDVQSTAGLRQRQQCRCRPSAFFTSYEEPVLPSDGKGSDGSTFGEKAFWHGSDEDAFLGLMILFKK